MRITGLAAIAFHTLHYQTAAPGGGSESRVLPILRGTIDTLPAELDALLIASDLQGVAPLHSADGAVALLGEVLAEELLFLADEGTIPSCASTGVVLAGDLFSEASATRRGATGDVRTVWRAFAQSFRWVTGVAGNHDEFGKSAKDREHFRQEPGVTLLDGSLVELDGLRIGGVGGIIGDPHKPMRRDEREFVRMLRGVLDQRPSMLVLHEGPDADRGALRGRPEIRQTLDRSTDLLVVCGHAHWSQPLASLRGGAQVLNVDGRAVLLQRG